jgi:hypothetical protein
MSEIEPGNHDEIARRLREEGAAQAPPDLAGEVMAQVRSQPRGATSRVRRPLVTVLAASLVAVALLVGVAKLGGGSGSSASGGSVAEGAASGGAPLTPGSTNYHPSAQAKSIIASRVIGGVPKSALSEVHGAFESPAATADSVFGAVGCPSNLSKAVGLVTLNVPYEAWASVQAKLENARRLLPYSSPLVTVHLRRYAKGVPVRGSVTCP